MMGASCIPTAAMIKTTRLLSKGGKEGGVVGASGDIYRDTLNGDEEEDVVEMDVWAASQLIQGKRQSRCGWGGIFNTLPPPPPTL